MSQALKDALQSKYGLTVDNGTFILCQGDIQANRARELAKVSSRITHYLLKIGNVPVAVAYDTRNNIITSILNPVPIAP